MCEHHPNPETGGGGGAPQISGPALRCFVGPQRFKGLKEFSAISLRQVA